MVSHFPIDGPWRMAMGLMALKPDDWIEVDGELGADLGEKRRLLAERHDDVFAALPDTAAAGREVLELLAAFLPQRFSQHYTMKSRTIVVRPLMESHNLDDTALHPLDLAGRLVQEDLCLMRPAGSSHILAAASLCFPTRWRLNEKIGRALDAIHAPVPGLNERMGGAMARFFHHAKTDRPVWRLGWSLVDSPALFQPGGDGRTERDPTITSENAGARVWLRVERQTLRRLAVSGNVLFTIRIHRTPLGLVAADRVKAALLRDALATMPPEIARYKSLPVLGAAVIAYLERQISP